MVRKIFQSTLRAIGILTAGIIASIAIISPIFLIIFSAEIEGYNKGPLITAIVTICIIGIVGFTLFGKQIKQSITNRKSPEQRGKLTKTAKFNKISPFLILGIVLFAYNFYFPQWIYAFNVNPKFGPYIAIHGAGGIQISWDTRSETISELYYGIDENNPNITQYGGQYYWQSDSTLKSTHHCVLLQNLEPNTTYYYKIPTVGNKIYNFKTGPFDNQIDEVVFTILGDTQGNLNMQQNNIARMKQTVGSMARWDFTIIAGDLSNRDDDITQWAMVFDKNSFGGVAPYIPWMACSGNHETGSTNPQPPRQQFKQYFQNSFASNWTNPDKNWDIGTYYSYNYSNVHIAMVDTLENKSHLLSQRQLTWLDQDLINAKAAGMWTFIVFHSSMYSTSEHGPYPNLADQMEPLMKKHRIDAMFWGHDHIYESYHAFSNESYGGTYCFMVSGGGGSLKKVMDPGRMGKYIWEGKTNEYGNYINNVSACIDDRFADRRGSEWQLFAERTFHYMQIEIYGDSANLTAYRTSDASIIQSFNITKNN
jgi:hypothetical protein